MTYRSNALLVAAPASLIALCMAVLGGCSSDDASSGTLNVLVEAETTISNGLVAGSGVEDIADGWDVSFEKYLVNIGEVELRFATDTDILETDNGQYVVDLVLVGESSVPLFAFESIDSGRWEFNYHTLPASSESQRHDTTDQADFDRMVSDSLTYLIKGTITNPTGVSCPPPGLATPPDGQTGEENDGVVCYTNTEISFELPVGKTTEFGRCEIGPAGGVSVTEGGDSPVALTIHGDHMFFNGFPDGDESGVTRLAQWFADSDLNLDGEVTVEELEAIAPSDLREIDERYSLPGGAPIEVDNMFNFVEAQTKTQGHVEGEGECSVDGAENEHGHGDGNEDEDEHDDDDKDGDDEHGHDDDETAAQ